MKVAVITVLGVLTFICVMMMVLEFTVKSTLRSTYRCPRCYKLNTKVAMPQGLVDESLRHSAKCEYCGENMKSGRGYKSMFLGRRPCTDGEGNYVLKKQLHAVDVSIIIWGVLIVMCAVSIVIAAVRM